MSFENTRAQNVGCWSHLMGGHCTEKTGLMVQRDAVSLIFPRVDHHL